MILQEVLYKVAIRSVHGKLHVNVKNLHIDSREVENGSAFIAVRGTHVDGHQFIPAVTEKKPAAIICEKMPERLAEGITYIQVENSAVATGLLAHNFFGQPSEKMKLIGITGTNGKTTIATLLFKLFSSLGYSCGLLSTVENRIGARVLPATHTTPDAISLNALLGDMVSASCTHVFMEVSSHAIDQHRVEGLHFSGGIFSNITHDHLDYHKTFDEYIRVKKSFFDTLPSTAFALSNADDKRGAVMLQNTAAPKYYYSLRTTAAFKGKILENNLTGLVMTINEREAHFRLIGEFNAYNLLAVYGAATCLGEDKEHVLRNLSALTGAEGRFDYILSPKEKIVGIVDYAHTPDALENVLSTLRKLRKNDERIITVVGCGGDRDKTKRPIMGEVACRLSDQVVFTSDNPRSEEAGAILKEMETGLNTAARRKFISVMDRKEAIKTAVNLSKPADILLVAGKGHEKYQEIKGVKYPFDDKAVLKEIFETLDK
ncbi:MAG: UDP-N-acetylmuramoyl-L-alanyl-D-glutamate--2,6-diaminopimelate ligase [Bacteroidota bacterium]|nr:UDP-N-acetylmuramoyl-L-alanyl-D-glutamate--2,6-diaminopimelate ligase [Bacteroidota bacterium]MDP4250428.1 UDP-N-acetylmuramoyl-L-alanyl-D-glutamate--2,6-diaminopimelate ligase [Bacteroidota bacterium]